MLVRLLKQVYSRTPHKTQNDLIAIRDRYREFFNRDGAEVILADMAHRFHVYDSKYHGPDETLFRDGQRSVVMFILDVLDNQDLLKSMEEKR